MIDWGRLPRFAPKNGANLGHRHCGLPVGLLAVWETIYFGKGDLFRGARGLVR